MVPHRQRRASLADGANLVAQARRTEFALLTSEALAKRLDDGLGQAFACGISELPDFGWFGDTSLSAANRDLVPKDPTQRDGLISKGMAGRTPIGTLRRAAGPAGAA